MFQEFDPSVAENPPCRGGWRSFHMLRRKNPPDGVVMYSLIPLIANRGRRQTWENSIHFPNCWEKGFVNGWSEILTIFPHASLKVKRDSVQCAFRVLMDLGRLRVCRTGLSL
ncbi:hypothetical protein TNCV_187301 [Trichonephila clavipes]|nr:hypothetical protein TNCV_187301 [Trichonephila clavipes]